MIDDDMPTYLALASGLDISDDMHESLETHLMMEYLTGELLCTDVSFLPFKSDYRIKNARQEYRDLS